MPPATVIAPPGTPTLYAIAAVALAMVVLWLVSLRLRDVSIVDLFWGPAFLLVALTVALSANGDGARRWLFVALTALWGARLALYLMGRKRLEPGEDRRYAAMRLRRPATFARWSLVMVFGVQGLFVIVVSLPIQVAGDSHAALAVSALPGIALFAVGFALEALADEQLRRFKADPSNQGAVMDRGLWRYSRHPNYFGDFCVWWGIWLVALPAGGTWWTFVGPLLMSALLIGVSGKPMLESTIAARRPGYAEYVRRTSGFVPLPPRCREGPSRAGGS